MSLWSQFTTLFTRRPRVSVETAATIARHHYMHAMTRLIRDYDLPPARKAMAIEFASDVWSRHVLGKQLYGAPEALVRDYCDRMRSFADNDQPGPNIAPQVTPIETARLMRRARVRFVATGPDGAAA